MPMMLLMPMHILMLLLAFFYEPLVLANGNSTVTLRLKKFRNFDNFLWDGSDCHSPPGPCGNIFEFCIKEFQPVTSTSFSDCLYYKKTNVFTGTEINFELTPTGIDKDIVLSISSYTGLALLMNITNHDPSLSNPLIDTHIFGQMFPPGYNGTTRAHSRVSLGQRETSKSRLSFTVKVSCDQYYFDDKCSTYCKSTDDSTGHYTCDSSGNRVCHADWYKHPNCLTYCFPHDDNVNGHYTCGVNGTHICRPNWYNLPNCTTYCKPHNDWSNGHYTCAKNGTRVCRPHWYNLPNCTINCEPKDDVSGHYTCSNNGSRICQPNWYNHPKCDTYCVPRNDTINGHYTCVRDGTHLCHPRWFKLPNCTVYCEPKDDDVFGHYICDRNGAKKCRNGWSNPPNCTTELLSSSFSLHGRTLIIQSASVYQHVVSSLTTSSKLIPFTIKATSREVHTSASNSWKSDLSRTLLSSAVSTPTVPVQPENTDRKSQTFWKWLVETDLGKSIFYGTGVGFFLVASLGIALQLCRRSQKSHTTIRSIKVAPLTELEMKKCGMKSERSSNNLVGK